MHEKDDFLKKVIIAMAIFLLFFTIAIIVIFAITCSEPSVLIASVFAACLGEGSICGLLKKSKNESEKDDPTSNDECENEEDEIDEDALIDYVELIKKDNDCKDE